MACYLVGRRTMKFSLRVWWVYRWYFVMEIMLRTFFSLNKLHKLSFLSKVEIKSSFTYLQLCFFLPLCMICTTISYNEKKNSWLATQRLVNNFIENRAMISEFSFLIKFVSTLVHCGFHHLLFLCKFYVNFIC